MTARAYAAQKIGRRWGIVDEATGEAVYVRPDFLLPVLDRSVLHRLASEMAAAASPIEAIMAHESAHNPRLGRNRSRKRNPRQPAATAFAGPPR